MESTLKQRLIGTAVIIALAVIFVPMILDGSGQQESIAINVEVPPEPKFTFESDLPDAKQLDDLPAIKNEKATKAKQPTSKEKGTTETVSAPAQPQKPKVVEATANHIKPKPSLSGWAVQVAAFAEEGKALALQEKLLAGNYSAFTEKTSSGNKAIYRVKVGPELKRENAEKLRDKITKEHGLDGSFVINHP